MTRSAYHSQLLRCEHIASELNSNRPHLRLFNATEGGAYIKGFEHISLSEFASTRNLNNTDHVKQVLCEQSTPIKPTHVTDYLAQVGETMDQITTIANTIIKLDTTTEKNADDDKVINEMLQEFRFLNGTTSLLQIAMQEEISSVIGTSNSSYGHSSLSEFFTNIVRHAEALKSVTYKQGT
jgi:hypothetical protein